MLLSAGRSELRMPTSGTNTRRIAKNVGFLYMRMLVMMVISFITTRVMLRALGVDNYGINNVVGGLVSMFSMLSASLSGAVSRFFTFGLGKGDMKHLRVVFSTSINIHIVLAVIVLVAIETVGVWFLNHRMVIAPDRLGAANWVLQCSTIVFAINLLSVPYRAAIIAHERMSAFAYLTIFDATAKLLIVCAIYFYGGDKLKLLAVLNIIPTLIAQVIYWGYCKRNFVECRYECVYDKKLFGEIFSFAGWSFIGNTAGLMKNEGVNVVINTFTGAAVNAARGIAMQVNGVVMQFISNFTMALNPQIIKDYAAGQLERMHKLMFQGTKLSYYIFMILSIPVIFEIETFLHVWLGEVPAHTVLFTRLVLVLSLAEIVSHTLITAQTATGKIKVYQMVVGGILLLNLPVSYLLLRWGWFPEVTVIVAIIISQLCLVARLWFLRRMIDFPVRKFVVKVYCNVLVVTLLSLIVPTVCYLLMPAGLVRFFVLCSLSVFSSAVVIYFVGCNREERVLIGKAIRSVIAKFRRG